MLEEEGFQEVYNLQGGIKAWQGITVAGPPDMGIELAREMVSAEDIIRLAYGMEKSLGRFYREASEKTGDPEAAELLGKLAGIEEKHKQQLADLWGAVSGAETARASLEIDGARGALEGGLSTGDYLERVTANNQGVKEVISVAMMFEAQAMDFYMRCSEEISQPDANHLLHNLAQQEKGHLAALGDLMDRKA
jgi:rubrerythrin